MGIVGLVLAIFCSLIGMIVSIIAFNKSKQAGFKNNIALAGIIVGAVLFVIGLIYNLTVGLPMMQQMGGMGAVHLVTDELNPHGAWALKELSMARVQPDELAQLIEDFRREAQLLRALSHPNLVKVYDNFSEGGKEFLVMEYVQGQTLDSLAGGRLMDETEVLGYAFQLCDVLAYLHGHQPPIIYRDLKPGNIMVEANSGILKLIDFGIAGAVGDDGDEGCVDECRPEHETGPPQCPREIPPAVDDDRRGGQHIGRGDRRQEREAFGVVGDVSGEVRPVPDHA